LRLQNLTLVGSKDRAQARPFEVEGSSRKAGLFYQLKGPVLASVRRWGLLRRRHEMVATDFVMQPQCEPNVGHRHGRPGRRAFLARVAGLQVEVEEESEKWDRLQLEDPRPRAHHRTATSTLAVFGEVSPNADFWARGDFELMLEIHAGDAIALFFFQALRMGQGHRAYVSSTWMNREQTAPR